MNERHLLYQLGIAHRTIRYYQAFGANPDVRDQLLQMTSNLTGTKHQTLSEAISEIEIKIAKLKTGT
jgi:hypothetical protein